MKTPQQPLHFNAQSTAAEVMAEVRLDHKTIFVTGGHSGVGLESTRVFALAGARVIIGARDVEKARQSVKKFPNVEVVALDLSSPRSVEACARQFLENEERLDLLVNNAGIMATPLTRDARGYELQFATNHLGHFQLTLALWPALVAARTSRVVTLTSFGHRFGGVDFKDLHFQNRPYDKWVAYGQSKTANALFTVELDRRGAPHGIRAFAVHPGRIPSTELMRHMSDEEVEKAGVTRSRTAPGLPGVKTIEQGAATTVWCAVSPELQSKGGVYCADCDISPLVSDDSPYPSGVRRWAVDPEAASALWELSEKLGAAT